MACIADNPGPPLILLTNNTYLIVANPVSGTFWNYPIDSFPAPLFEQLQSTNTCYEQVGTALYIIGGYGFSRLANDHITYSDAHGGRCARSHQSGKGWQ